MILVYLSPVRWDSIAQRPHFFAKTALEQGFDQVLWIEPTASRLPELRDLRTKLRSIEASSFDKPERVRIIPTKLIPLEPLGKIYDLLNAAAVSKVINSIKQELQGQPAVFAAGKPSRLGLQVLESIDFELTVFDVMDDYEHFFKGLSAKNIATNLKKMMAKVDVCCFSSHGLLEKYGLMAKEKLLILNACDRGFYQTCKGISKVSSTSETLTYGYVGSIAAWFDWAGVIKLANDNPDAKVLLVGPNYSTLPVNLPQNIEIRPAVVHKDIPALMSSFDYGLIPFQVNSLTECVDPVKYYEYSACGVKVISTHFGEMKYRLENNNVYSFDDYKTASVREPEKIVTWDERFLELFQHIAQKNSH
jgi:hypothetical protein